ncbi:tetratricopeptide repeat protein [Nocardiopsis chromatogenes]|uniref:tetratricopeptide repeat protein n=1 Tax=Nocardiopsis chromatogenes TaxID=280239 RepID=UPI00034A627C|nr:tetratricopeptide repeat protein [Nocardiopsis chromatogenes]
MDPHRVVEVWSPGNFGTGYLVTETAVLTSWHTVAPPGLRPLEPPEVRPLGGGAWSPAQVVWPPEAPDIDADPASDVALLRIDAPSWVPPAAGTVLWGRITGGERRPCRAIGFPTSERKGDVRDTKDISGHIERFTGVKSGLITVHVDGSAAPSAPVPPGSGSRWSGASGTGLFCGEFLVGVVTTDRTSAYSADQLVAVPTAPLAEDPGFLTAVGTAPDLRDLPPPPGSATEGGNSGAGGALLPTNLPAPATRVFVGREAELSALAERMRDGTGVVTQALQGLGGIGKTALALEYAHAHADDHRLVWWIDADTPGSVARGLAALARALPGVSGTDDPDEQAAASSIAWLRANPGWLLVLDNAAAPSELSPVLGPIQDAGHVLITSRYTSGWPGAAPIELGALDEDAAVELLTVLTEGTDPGQGARARELAEELGFLPLALQQAAAFIAETCISYDEYLRLLRQYPSDLLGTESGGGSEGRTVARTWRVTLDRIAQSSPLSVELLRILAWFAPHGIPRSVLDVLHKSDADHHAPKPPHVRLAHDMLSGYRREDIPEGLRDRMHEDPSGSASPSLPMRLADTPVALHKALGTLRTYSMISLDRDTISVHRLVQAISRIPDPADPHRSPESVAFSRERAAVLIKAAMPINPTFNIPEWPQARTLLPHVAALAAACPSDLDSESSMRVWETSSEFLRSQRLGAPAVAYSSRAVAVAERLHGRDSPVAIYEREGLAAACLDAGDIDRAVELYEGVLHDREHVEGPPGNAMRTVMLFGSVWNGLSTAYLAREEPEKAVHLRERVLSSWEAALEQSSPSGPEKPDSKGSGPRERLLGTAPGQPLLGDEGNQAYSIESHVLQSRKSLASALILAGQTEQGVEMLERAAADSERLFGPDHRGTQTILFDLGFGYLRLRRPEAALRCFERTAEAAQRRIGPDHPDTIDSLKALGTAHNECGRPERAIQLYEQALESGERAVGAASESTRATRRSLASLYRRTDGHDRAVALLQQELEVAEGFPGDVPGILDSAHALASAYIDSGLTERAVPLLQRFLDEGEADGGPGVERLLEARLELAMCNERAGRHSQNAHLLEQAIPEAEDALDADSPLLHAGRRLLATASAYCGAPQRAIDLLEMNLLSEERTWGQGDERTVATYTALAALHANVGHSQHAIAYYRRALAGAERSSEQPPIAERLDMRLRLANEHMSVTEHREAVAVLAEVLDDPERRAEADEEWLFEARRTRAICHEMLGEVQHAAEFLSRSLSDAERLIPHDPRTAIVRAQLGRILLACERHEEARDTLERSVPEIRALRGADDADTVTVRQNLAMAHLSAGNRERGLTLLAECLRDAERVFGSEHGLTRAIARTLSAERGAPSAEASAPPLLERLDQAKAAEKAGHLSTAISAYRALLEESERGAAPDEMTTLAVRMHLAESLREAEEHDAALPVFERCATDSERILGATDARAVTARSMLGFAYLSAGREDPGIREMERVAEQNRRSGAASPRIAAGLYLLGMHRAANGDSDAAVAVLEQALAAYEETSERDSPDLPWVRFHLARVCLQARQAQRAVELLDTFIDHNGELSSGVADATDVRTFMWTFADACSGSDLPGDAVDMYRFVVQDLDSDPEADAWERIDARHGLGTALLNAGSADEAIPELRRARADARAALPSDDARHLEIRARLATAYEAADDQERAIEEFTGLAADAEHALGDDHPFTESVRTRLQGLHERTSPEPG